MKNDVLRKIQLTQLEIMKYIDSLCRKNGIIYYLSAGSMLGAVRHNGFIPWDDDLDIMLLRDDYEKLLDLIINDKPDMYWLQSYKTDEQYWNPFAKVRKKGTVYKEKGMEQFDDDKCGVWVDIFPLDYVKKPKGFLLNARKFFVKTIGLSLRKRAFNLKIRKFSRRYIPIMLFWECFDAKTLKSLQNKIMRRQKKGDFVANIGSTDDIQKETYPCAWFQEVEEILFEDSMFYIPSKYDKHLKQLYNNYMELPPLDKRQGHNISDSQNIIV